MNVILCEDVDNLGFMGERVKVAGGYARNFLLPRKLAVVADSASAAQIEHEMRIIRKREEKRRVELTEVSKGMAELKVEFIAKASREGKLFGSITTLHIAKKLVELGHEVNRKKIKLSDPIKTPGDHEVVIQLGAGVEATITVTVTPEVVDEPVSSQKPATDEKPTEAVDAAESTDEDEASTNEDSPDADTAPEEASGEGTEAPAE